MSDDLLPDDERATLDRRLFMSVAEFAKLSGLDPRTVRRGIEAGEIPAVHISHRIRIPVPKVREMLGLPPLVPAA